MQSTASKLKAQLAGNVRVGRRGEPTLAQKQAAGMVIAQMNEIMHDKKNMMRMKDMFTKFDENRNGYLNSEEFKHVLKEFHSDINPKHVELVIQLFDKNGDGELEYGEFAKMLMSREYEKYRPLAVHEEAPKTMDELNKTRSQIIDTVKKKRIRLERTDSVCNDLRLQGNLEHYSIKALQQRDNLKRNEFVKQGIVDFWNSIDMIKDQFGNICRDTYIGFNVKLQLAMVDDVEEETATSEADGDWERDSVEGEYMSYVEFSKSMFELADMWVDTIDAREYTAFLRHMLNSIAHRLDGPVRWKHNSNIEKRQAGVQTAEMLAYLAKQKEIEGKRRRRSGRRGQWDAPEMTHKEAMEEVTKGMSEVEKTAMGEVLGMLNGQEKEEYVQAMVGMNREERNRFTNMTKTMSVEQRGQMLSAMEGMNEVERGAFGKSLASMSEEGKELLLGTMSGMDEIERSNLTASLQGISEEEKLALVKTLASMDEEERRQFVEALAYMDREGRQACTDAVAGMDANQRKDFVAAVANLGDEEGEELVKALRKMSQNSQKIAVSRLGQGAGKRLATTLSDPTLSKQERQHILRAMDTLDAASGEAFVSAVSRMTPKEREKIMKKLDSLDEEGRTKFLQDLAEKEKLGTLAALQGEAQRAARELLAKEIKGMTATAKEQYVRSLAEETLTTKQSEHLKEFLEGMDSAEKEQFLASLETLDSDVRQKVLGQMVAKSELHFEAKKEAKKAAETEMKAAETEVQTALKLEKAAMDGLMKVVSLDDESEARMNFMGHLATLDLDTKQLLAKTVSDLGLDAKTTNLLISNLAQFGDKTSQSAILRVLAGMDAESCSCFVAMLSNLTLAQRQALLGAMQDMDEDAKRDFLETLAGMSSEEVMQFLTALRSMGGGAQSAKAFLDATADMNAEERHAALAALSKAGGITDDDTRRAMISNILVNVQRTQQGESSAEDAQVLALMGNATAEEMKVLMNAMKNMEEETAKAFLTRAANMTTDERAATVAAIRKVVDGGDEVAQLALLNGLATMSEEDAIKLATTIAAMDYKNVGTTTELLAALVEEGAIKMKSKDKKKLLMERQRHHLLPYLCSHPIADSYEGVAATPFGGAWVANYLKQNNMTTSLAQKIMDQTTLKMRQEMLMNLESIEAIDPFVDLSQGSLFHDDRPTSSSTRNRPMTSTVDSDIFERPSSSTSSLSSRSRHRKLPPSHKDGREGGSWSAPAIRGLSRSANDRSEVEWGTSRKPQLSVTISDVNLNQPLVGSSSMPSLPPTTPVKAPESLPRVVYSGLATRQAAAAKSRPSSSRNRALSGLPSRPRSSMFASTATLSTTDRNSSSLAHTLASSARSTMSRASSAISLDSIRTSTSSLRSELASATGGRRGQNRKKHDPYSGKKKFSQRLFYCGPNGSVSLDIPERAEKDNELSFGPMDSFHSPIRSMGSPSMSMSLNSNASSFLNSPQSMLSRPLSSASSASRTSEMGAIIPTSGNNLPVRFRSELHDSQREPVVMPAMRCRPCPLNVERGDW